MANPIEDFKGNAAMAFTYYKKILSTGSIPVQKPTPDEVLETYENDPVLSDFVDNLTACFIKILIEQPF